MYILLILFFASLVGIIIMISQKLALIKNSDTVVIEEITIEFPNLQEWKISAIQNVKKYGRIGLISILRFYFRSKNIVKGQYQELRKKIKALYKKETEHVEQKVEVSKFLKMVSEYKQKIREIKHQIHEEENL